MKKETADFKLLEIKKSTNPKKKYMAMVLNKKTGRVNIFHFGAIRENGEPYPQWKDQTGLGIYSKYDHKDNERRARYRARHQEGSFPSPAWFSFNLLW